MSDYKPCGKCARFRGDNGYCAATGRYVNALSIERCFVDKNDDYVPTENRITMLRRGLKRCKDCGQLLPLSDFPKHPTSHDGHDGLCLECKRKKSRAAQRKSKTRRERYEEQREKLPDGMKRCKRCGKVLPVSAFGRHASTFDHLQASCTECRSKQQREYWQNLRAQNDKSK